MEIRGIPAAPGYAIGAAHVCLERGKPLAVFPDRPEAAGASNPAAELARLAAAVEDSRRELEALAAKTRQRVGEAEAFIFQSHLALLQDPEIVGAAERLIPSRKITAETAISGVTEEVAELFEGMDDDPVLRERAVDVRDVGGRILSHLANSGFSKINGLPDGSILVADELSPSDTARIDASRVRGFALDRGGPTSHSAILARAMGLAAVVGLNDFRARVREGDTLIVDGEEGKVILRPDSAVVKEYERKIAELGKERSRIAARAGGETRTKTGKRIVVAANIGSPAEVKACLENGAEGIGLFRTEFLYLGRSKAPDEQEQYEAYKTVLEQMASRPVVIRTLDIGGDKEAPFLGLPPEDNPFLGMRAIRLCLRDPRLFKNHLRALLRASAHGNLRIMFPMIGSLEELRAAKAELAECASGLSAEGAAFRKDIEVGIMIEIPSAALCADDLAAECDFFSIGTNDLTQYALAVDRMNSRVADLYNPLHPAVLRLIKMSIDAAHARGISCGMCGELAGDPRAIPLLLEYGLDEFSMSASFIPKAKEAIVSAN